MTRAEGIFCDPHGGIFHLIVGTFHKIGQQFSIYHSKTGKFLVAIAAWNQKYTDFTPGGGYTLRKSLSNFIPRGGLRCGAKTCKIKKSERRWCAWMTGIQSRSMTMSIRTRMTARMNMTTHIRMCTKTVTRTSIRTTMKTQNTFRTGWRGHPVICSMSGTWSTAARTAQMF